MTSIYRIPMVSCIAATSRGVWARDIQLFDFTESDLQG